MGDSIDNIKGVPGIGEKGARDLIATYGSIESLLAHATEVSNKRYREGLLNHADDARQSRELARIRTDVPVVFDPDAVRYRGALAPALLRALHAARVPNARARVRTDGGNGRQGLRDRPVARRSAGASTELQRPAASDCACSPTHRPPRAPGSSASRFRPHRGARDMCRSPTQHERAGICSAVEPATSRPGIDRDAALALLKPLLEDASLEKIGHDLKFDAIVLGAARHHAPRTRHRRDDCQLSAGRQPIGASARRHGDRAQRLQGAAAKRTFVAAAPRQCPLLRFPSSARETTPASARTCRCSSRPALVNAAEDERTASSSTTSSSSRSSRCSSTSSARASGSTPRRWPRRPARLDQELARLAGRIYELAGEEFNINSPKKLSEILFDRLGMRTETIRRTTKTKAQSTAFEVLEELALTHELPRLVLEWRSQQKLKGTYIDALPAARQPGRPAACTPASTRPSRRRAV